MAFNANNVREGVAEYEEDAIIRVKKVSTNSITIQVPPTPYNWTVVRGCLDSGCDRTVGSYAKLQGLCNNLQPPRRVKMLELPQGTQIPMKAVGKTYIRVILQGAEPFDFGPTLIFLVDDPNWKDLLIGRDALAKYGLLPEQQMEKQRRMKMRNHKSRTKMELNS